MSARALVVAIEDYPHSGSLAQLLPGTNTAAAAFLKWLAECKGLKPADVWLCCGPGIPDGFSANRTGTERAQIRDAIKSLADTARDGTAELFCFFSGHGFSYSTRTGLDPVDVLVCSDFVAPATSGDSCIGLQELQQKLSYWIGGQSHYYFTDICRTEIPENQIDVTSLGLALSSAQLGRPQVYTLFSTASGAAAAVGSGFAGALLDGLRGSGHAKGWVDDAEMWVLFDLLVDYVKQHLKGQEAESRPGGGQGKIFKLPQVPEYDCQVNVANADPRDAFQAELQLRGIVAQRAQFTGQSTTLRAKPGTYVLRVTHPTASVVQVDPPAGRPMDLFEPCRAILTKAPTAPIATHAVLPSTSFDLSVPAESAPQAPSIPPPAAGTPPTMAEATLNVRSLPATTIEVRNLHTGKLQTATESFSGSVDPGLYRITILEAGAPIQEEQISIEPGQQVVEDFSGRPMSPVRANILSAVSGRLADRVADFSEELGPIASRDLGLWLSVIGASRIIAQSDLFSKLGPLQLQRFEDMQPSQAAVYLLAAFDQAGGPFFAALGDPQAPNWLTAKEVPEMAGVAQLRLDVKPGPNYLSVSFPNSPTLTMVTQCLPNRVTLVTFSQEAKSVAVRERQPVAQLGPLRHLRAYQFLLPLYTLEDHLDPSVRVYLSGKQDLRTVRAMFLIQAQYCRQREVEAKGAPEVGPHWQEALAGKWLDPIMSIIACYELIRRGCLGERRNDLQAVTGNLDRYFEGIPDTVAIRKLLGETVSLPVVPPLFTDGLLAFAEYQSGQGLPLPPNKLHYGSPWTSWKNAVAPPVPAAAQAPASTVAPRKT